jgi:catechol 2,3-dioxygenase-like lactoylglutathione lyase family enzyme
MAVTRIVANVAASDLAAAQAFYGDILGLTVTMDLGWIVTFAASGARATPQVSVAREGGSGTAVPDLSVEVDDFDAVLDRARRARLAIVYGPCVEPWGVRRFYVEDPFGRLVNILSHT